MSGLRRVIFEEDDDFNPSLLLWSLAGLANVAVAVTCIIMAFLYPIQATALLAIAGITTSGALASFGIGWMNMGKAKLAANNRTAIAAQAALGRFAEYDRDERDEEQLAMSEARAEDR